MVSAVASLYVWLADLTPPHGTEPRKTRPVLLVQAQALLDADHPSTLVIPLTTRLEDDADPLRIRIAPNGKLRKESDLLIDQLRAIDNHRLVNGPLAKLSQAQIHKVDQALAEVLDLV